MAPREPVSDEDKQTSKAFLIALGNRYQGGWHKLVHDADINPNTAAGYRVGRAVPDGVRLLRLLETAGGLREEMLGLLADARRHGAEAAAATTQLEEIAQRSRVKPSKK